MTADNDTAPFVRGLVLAAVFYAIAFVVLSVGGTSARCTVVGAVVRLIAAAAVLQLTLTHGRDAASRPSSGWPCRWRSSPSGCCWSARGACYVARTHHRRLGAGGRVRALSGHRPRARRTAPAHGRAPRRGLWVGAVCAGVFVLGLILCFTVSGWWLVLCAVAVLSRRSASRC